MRVSRVKNTWMRTTLVVAMAAGLSASLQGCFLLAAGAVAGGGALVATDRRSVGAQTEDREIQVRALSDLQSNLPDSAHVNVTVFNRRVLLTGEVAGDASKQRAETVIRNINNVTGIVNELTIAPASNFSSRSNDTYIGTRVKTALIGEKNISANNFKVVCERGTVYLMGLVTRAEGDTGADVASRVPGVVQVVKVFQYIQAPDQAAAAAGGSALEPASATPSSANTEEPTVGAVPMDSSVSSRPLEQQSPAPVSNSMNVHPGNPKAPAQ